MATTEDELQEAQRLAGKAAGVLGWAEQLVDEAVDVLKSAVAALARPGEDSPTEAQLRQAARYRIALTEAIETLRTAGLGGDSG